ncbi:Glycosyltransferase, catalytic subunit of cellulose synthase and poly-beta-1,6-N-acetylglucosamine synthase [Belliella buryatensis]|uniref:Glycosyltransferase, catalytic subunit of cellulose synthase and poly-beta-1,6-N-acetylglucosamine synthase n=1 Tax=Belliella buryatensis TaxID=1500549 RepID=A0A239FB10_9BACT|nr:glycosyltransferase [Belliella buryatensis]SNS54007.1 Glycosyltransferase, catalytic subunit of cellulose synthase and poly-beta-1,6-N-acetylglucosamine synthase [Belliella buryatensis]
MVAIELIGVMLLLCQNLFLVVFLRTNFRTYHKKEVQELPQISILIPARNEAAIISQCLQELEQLDYPKEKLQIILGNDQSTDDTAEIIQEWVANKPYASLINIVPTIAERTRQINGKANALAQMGNFTTGDYLLFTDADCSVPASWAKEMIRAAQSSDQVGFVTGVTTVRPLDFYAKMQDYDWLFTLGMVKVLSDLGLSVTTMGNNMLVAKKAYDAVGGFSGLKFSLTEDFEIAQSIQKKGFKGIHQVSYQNLIVTQAQPNLFSLLEQRKRWMYGAMKLPLTIKALLALQALFLPLVILLIVNYTFLGWLFWLTKWSIQSYFIYLFKRKISQEVSLFALFFFEIYYLFTAWTTILYYFWPSKTNWKGRKY